MRIKTLLLAVLFGSVSPTIWAGSALISVEESTKTKATSNLVEILSTDTALSIKIKINAELGKGYKIVGILPLGTRIYVIFVSE